MTLQRTPESWNMGLGGLVLGSPKLYLKGMGILMFQLSGFYCRRTQYPKRTFQGTFFGRFKGGFLKTSKTRFPSSPLTIRLPFFLLFGFNRGTQKEKG